MDTTSWIHLGILIVAGTGSIASAAWAIISLLGRKVDERFDKVDYQFGKVDLKFDEASRQFNERIGQVTTQIDRLRDVGNDRHIANIERLARLEGQISALPQKIDKNGQK